MPYRMEDEFLNYLGLVPISSQVDKVFETKKSQKPPRRLIKFLTKIPICTIWDNENFTSISTFFDTAKIDSSFKRFNNVTSETEKYINNDKHVEVAVRSYKRRSNISSDKIGLSRRSRLLKREMKSCEVKVQFLTIDEILKNKLSDDTKQFIHKAYSKPILTHNSPKENSSSDEDQAILVETRFRELNSGHFSIYNEDQPIEKHNNNSYEKLVENVDSENFFDIESVMMNSPIKYNKTKNFFKSERQTIPFRILSNSPGSKIELIDLTEC